MATINNHNTESYLNEKQTVLIVDDSKVIRLALNKILKNDFVVIQANDGEDAWEKLQENDAVAAIFSDVSMPNLDGFGLLERVRTSTEARISELPFVIITANDDDPDFSSKVSNAGGNDLITKPFKTDEIKACIQNHIAVEQTAQKVPSENIPAMPDQEVVEILGIDGIEPADHHPSSDSLLADMELSVDENFFETVNETTSTDGLVELATDINLEQEDVTTAEDSNDLSSMADIDFSFDEDVLNETLEPTLNDTISVPDEFEFTLDEEFLNSSIESTHRDTVSNAIEPVENASSTNDTNNSTNEMSFADEEFNLTEETPEPSKPVKELSLVPKNLEQARRQAMEVAQEKVQPNQDTVTDKVHQTTEREQIRARLQQIREQEKQDLADARNARRVTRGNNTSLFGKLGRIISNLFTFRKK